MKAPLIFLSVVCVASVGAAFHYYSTANELNTQVLGFQHSSDDLKGQVQTLQASDSDQKSQIETLQGELAERNTLIAQLQPLAQKARHLPVKCRVVSGAAFGPGGYVLQIFNQDREPLRVEVTLKALDKTSSQNRVIKGGSFWSITQLAKGDHVTLNADGYDPREININ
jgi:DNA repair exonuclease SbcCD ATPase subunit